MYKWLIDSPFGKVGSDFIILHIKKPIIYMNDSFGIFNIDDMQWYYFYEGKDYEKT